jgi:hypothetical protein
MSAAGGSNQSALWGELLSTACLNGGCGWCNTEPFRKLTPAEYEQNYYRQLNAQPRPRWGEPALH